MIFNDRNRRHKTCRTHKFEENHEKRLFKQENLANIHVLLQIILDLKMALLTVISLSSL